MKKIRGKTKKKHEKIWRFKKIAVTLHRNSEMMSTYNASIAQLVRAPDC